MCRPGKARTRRARPADDHERAGMFRIIKLLFVLAVLGLLGLTGYAFLGDMSPQTKAVEVPVTLTPE